MSREAVWHRWRGGRLGTVEWLCGDSGSGATLRLPRSRTPNLLDKVVVEV